LLRDLGEIARLALILLRRSARNYFQICDLSQPRQDFRLDAIGKIRVIWIAAEIFERQNRDTLLRRQCRYIRLPRIKPNDQARGSGQESSGRSQDMFASKCWSRTARGRLCGAFSLRLLELLRQLRISNFVIIEIDDQNDPTVFRFAFAQLMQVRSPSRVILEVFSNVFREKNVPSIATVHYSPGDVDTSPGHIHLLVQISHFVDWAAVNSHTDSKFRAI